MYWVNIAWTIIIGITLNKGNRIKFMIVFDKSLIYTSLLFRYLSNATISICTYNTYAQSGISGLNYGIIHVKAIIVILYKNYNALSTKDIFNYIVPYSIQPSLNTYLT